MTTPNNQLSFKCAECGSSKLRLSGCELLSVAVGFEVGFADSGVGAADWNVDYTLPKDGPQAFVTCEKCRHEVKVSCRNGSTGRSAVLWPAEIYQMLGGVLSLGGIEEDAFKGQVTVQWEEFQAKLMSAHPILADDVSPRRYQ